MKGNVSSAYKLENELPVRKLNSNQTQTTHKNLYYFIGSKLYIQKKSVNLYKRILKGWIKIGNKLNNC